MPTDDSRKYPEYMAAKARKVIREWVDEMGGQETAAKDLGYTQGTISRALDQTKQPTLAFLIRFCDYKKLSIDAILGRAVPSAGDRPLTEGEVDAIARRTAEHLTKRQSEPPPPLSERRPSGPPLLPPHEEPEKGPSKGSGKSKGRNK